MCRDVMDSHMIICNEKNYIELINICIYEQSEKFCVKVHEKFGLKLFFPGFLIKNVLT